MLLFVSLILKENMNESSYNCPSCGSENTRKLSLINRDGISNSKGVAFAGNDVVRYRGNHQTASSRRASKPSHPVTILTQRTNITIILSLVAIFLGLPFIAGMFALLFFKLPLIRLPELLFNSLIPIALIIYIIYYRKQKKLEYDKYKEIYPTLLTNWENGYECQRCEKVFTLQ
jgi:hypothetical protein